MDYAYGVRFGGLSIAVAALPPVATGTFAPTDGQVGVVYSYQTASLFTGSSLTYTLGGNVLPEGLVLNAFTGEIAGTPVSSPASFAGISITATNGLGADTTNTASLLITEQWQLVYDSTNFGELSGPITIPNAGSVIFNFKTSGGVLQDFTDGYSITALDVFSTPVEVTDILIDDSSVGLGGDAPVDDARHKVEFVFSSMAEKNNVSANNADGDKFRGVIYDAEFVDDITPANSVSWFLDSGPPVYEVGADHWNSVTEIPISTSTVVSDTSLVIGSPYVLNLQGVIGTTLTWYDGSSWVGSLTDGDNIIYAAGETSLRLIDSSNAQSGLTISVNPYISIISDGTIYQESEEYDTEADIMRADDWGATHSGITTSGKIATFSGTQVPWGYTRINDGETYDGLLAVTFRAYDITAGSCYVSISGVGSVYVSAVIGEKTFALTANASLIKIEDNGGGGSRFVGKVEIISVKPVPQGLIYQNVTAADYYPVIANRPTYLWATFTATATTPAQSTWTYNKTDGHAEVINDAGDHYVYTNDTNSGVEIAAADGDVIEWYVDDLTGVTTFDGSSGNLSGNIPDLSEGTALTVLYLDGNLLTGFDGGWPTKAFDFDASDNTLTETAVNLILTDADTYGVATGTTINVSGGTNATPTGAGATAKANLITNGATVTTN